MPEFEFESRNGPPVRITADSVDEAYEKLAKLPPTIAGDMREYQGSWRERSARALMSDDKSPIWNAAVQTAIGSRGIGATNPAVADILPVFSAEEMLRSSKRIYPSIPEQQEMRKRGETPRYDPQSLVETALGSLSGIPGDTSAIPKVFRPTGGGFGATGTAERRVASAAQRDMATATGREATTISPAELEASAGAKIAQGKRQGQDVRLMDVGGEATRAEVRRAADRSPQARGVIQRTIDPRYEEQGGRILEWFKGAFHKPEQGLQTLEQIKEAAKSPTSAAYNAAYAAGSGGIETPEVTGIFASDIMKPFLSVADKRAEALHVAGLDQQFPMRTARTPQFPEGRRTLAYWDQVKRVLDDAVTKLRDAPDERKAFVRIRDQFRDALKASVPEYETALGTASRTFEAGNAFEAGQNVMKGKWDKYAIEQARKGMGPDELKQFQAGFLHDYLLEMRDIPTRADLFKRLARSDLEREKIRAMMGPQLADDFDAMLAVEGWQQMTKEALGNSQTVRFALQQLQPGTWRDMSWGAATALAGGAVTMDWRGLLAGALGWGAAKAMSAREIENANRVAAMLVSNDPKIYAEGIKEVGKSPMGKNLWKWLATRGTPETVLMGEQSAYDKAHPGERPASALTMPASREDMKPGSFYKQPTGPAEYQPRQINKPLPGQMRLGGPDSGADKALGIVPEMLNTIQSPPTHVPSDRGGRPTMGMPESERAIPDVLRPGNPLAEYGYTFDDLSRDATRAPGESTIEKTPPPAHPEMERWARPALKDVKPESTGDAMRGFLKRQATAVGGAVGSRAIEIGKEMPSEVREFPQKFGKGVTDIYDSTERLVMHGSNDPRQIDPGDVFTSLKPAMIASLLRAAAMGFTGELGMMGGKGPGSVRALAASLRGNAEYEAEANKVYDQLKIIRRRLVSDSARTANEMAAGYPKELASLLRLQKGSDTEKLAEYAENIAAWRYYVRRMGGNDFELGAFGARGKHLTFGRKLGEHTDIKTNFPEADFWIIRRGDPRMIGKPTNEFSPEHIGVRVRNHNIEPRYLQYAFEAAHGQGHFQQYATGALRLQHLRVADIERLDLSRIMRGSAASGGGEFELGAMFARPKTGDRVSITAVESVVKELGLQSETKLQGPHKTAYIKVWDPATPDKAAWVRVPSKTHQIAGSPLRNPTQASQRWRIDTNVKDARERVPTRYANVAGEPYERNLPALRDRIAYLFGRQPKPQAPGAEPAPAKIPGQGDLFRVAPGAMPSKSGLEMPWGVT